MKKRFIAILFFGFAAFQVLPGQAYGADCDGSDQNWTILKSKLIYMPSLSALLGGSEELGCQFAKAAPSRMSKEQDWLLFDSMLRGGKLDPDGRLIRAEISKLPPEQWYYVILLEGHRRILAEMGGGIYANLIQGLGNLFVPEKSEIHHMKCMEQTAELISRMEQTGGVYRRIARRWSGHQVTANFRKLNEHNAPCFYFFGKYGPVEIVADSWANVIVPARVWWNRFDPSVPKALSGRRGVCGPAYMTWDNDRVDALNAEERRQEDNQLGNYH